METTAEVKAGTKLCSSCGTKPRVDQKEKSTNTLCSECKYEAHKNWQARKTEQEQSQSFAAGVKAAKDLIAGEFRSKVGNAMITGWQAASLIGECRGPFPT